MQALLLLLAVPVVMWCVQSAALIATGERVRWRISDPELPSRIKRLNRVLTYVAIVALLACYPLWRGAAPLNYYARFFPGGGEYAEGLLGLGLSVGYLSLLYAIWWGFGLVAFERRDPPARLLRRMATVPLTAVLAALFEELLFRAVVLEDLLRSLPTAAAVGVGAVVFAAAHYVRSVKRYWTFPGHVLLGVLLCFALVWTGSLWLPVGLHAGGILVLMGVRPLVRYVGPAWLVGASVYPYAGVAGMAALILLIMHLWMICGAQTP